MDTITIVIVDDHPIFRQGVINTISIEPDLNVVADTDNGDEALNIIRKHKPDVVIMDVNLPGMNGQQVTRQIVSEKLPTRVVLLTAYDDVEQIIHSMRSGAAAYCAKHVKPESLVGIVRQVALGKYVIGTEVPLIRSPRYIEELPEMTLNMTLLNDSSAVQFSIAPSIAPIVASTSNTSDTL